MTYTEIMKLLDAGFNRDEILAMQNDENTEQNNDNDSGENKEQNNDNDSGENSENLNSAITEALAEVKSTFDEFKKEFTAMNIMNSRIDNPNTNTADDILANIINPFETDDK